MVGESLRDTRFQYKFIWRQYFVGLSKSCVRFVWPLALHHTSNTSIPFVLVCGEPTLPQHPKCNMFDGVDVFYTKTKLLSCFQIVIKPTNACYYLPVLSDTWLCIYKPLGQIALYKQPVQPQQSIQRLL